MCNNNTAAGSTAFGTGQVIAEGRRSLGDGSIFPSTISLFTTHILLMCQRVMWTGYVMCLPLGLLLLLLGWCPDGYGMIYDAQHGRLALK